MIFQSGGTPTCTEILLTAADTQARAESLAVTLQQRSLVSVVTTATEKRLAGEIPIIAYEVTGLITTEWPTITRTQPNRIFQPELLHTRRNLQTGPSQRLRDEFLNMWHFDSLLEAQVLIEDWRIDYNTNRPHSAHGDLTPTEYALQWAQQNQQVLS